jgi:hypothetical protein
MLKILSFSCFSGGKDSEKRSGRIWNKLKKAKAHPGLPDEPS